MVWHDVGAPGAIAFFQPQRLDRAVAGIDNAVRPPGGHERTVDGQSKLYRDVKLEAELANIGDTERKYWRPGESNSLRPAEGKGSIAHVVLSQSLEHIACSRPHDREHGRARSDVDQPGVEGFRYRARDPVEVVSGEAGAGYDVIFGFR